MSPGDDSSMDGMSMMMMPMYFSFRTQDTWLFKSFTSDNGGQFAGWLVLTFVISAFVQALTVLHT